MRAINANTVDIATNWLPSVRVLGDLRAGVITYRNVIREHMLSETLEEKQAQEKTLATVVESNTKIRAGLRADDHLAGRARAVQRMVQTLGKLQEGHAGSHGAVAQGRRPDSHEAHELNTKTVNKIGLEADAVLKKDIDLNNAGADKAARTRPTVTPRPS